MEIILRIGKRWKDYRQVYVPLCNHLTRVFLESFFSSGLMGDRLGQLHLLQWFRRRNGRSCIQNHDCFRYMEETSWLDRDKRESTVSLNFWQITRQMSMVLVFRKFKKGSDGGRSLWVLFYTGYIRAPEADSLKCVLCRVLVGPDARDLSQWESNHHLCIVVGASAETKSIAQSPQVNR